MRETIESQMFSREAIAARVKELGAQLSRDYSHCEPLVVVVLKGSAMFASDLLREMSISVEVDYIGTSSYGDATESSGHVRIVKDIGASLQNRHVIIVEDIVDTGVTLTYLTHLLQQRRPRSIQIAALLDKPSRRLRPVHAKYVGFTIPDEFVVGFGLDFAEDYRNLSDICVVGD